MFSTGINLCNFRKKLLVPKFPFIWTIVYQNILFQEKNESINI